MGLSTTANQVYRDYETDGVPASGPHEPIKSEIRGLWGDNEDQINLMVEAVAAGGAVIYDTQAHLYADLVHDAGTVGVVNADVDPEKNGLYSKLGASGAGSWSQVTKGTPWSAAEAAEASAAAAAASENNTATSAATATTKAGEASTSAATATTKAGEASDSAAAAAAAAAAIAISTGVYITQDAGVLEGGYYAEVYAPSGASLDRLYAEILNGSGSLHFTLVANGTILHQDDVVAGTPVNLSGLSLSYSSSDQVLVVISDIVGAVNSVIIQYAGAPA